MRGAFGLVETGVKKGRFSLGLSRLIGLMLLVSVLATGCGRRARGTLEHASDAWDSGNYEVAAGEFERYIANNPTGTESLGARFQLANIYYLNLHRYEQARAHYTAFLNQQPSHPDAYKARERLAEVLVELGRSYDAISELENLNPAGGDERRRIRLRIADLYVDQKNFNQALTEYEKVTEAGVYDDMTEQAYQREASILHIARGQHKQALSIYQKLAAETSSPEIRRRALYGMSDCHAGIYQFDEAIKILREIKDEGEQPYIVRRVSSLEKLRAEAAEARNAVQQQ
jgi:tetratricopeptide (TPR) repeat protein